MELTLDAVTYPLFHFTFCYRRKLYEGLSMTVQGNKFALLCLKRPPAGSTIIDPVQYLLCVINTKLAFVVTLLQSEI